MGLVLCTVFGVLGISGVAVTVISVLLGLSFYRESYSKHILNTSKKNPFGYEGTFGYADFDTFKDVFAKYDWKVAYSSIIICEDACGNEVAELHSSGLFRFNENGMIMESL